MSCRLGFAGCFVTLLFVISAIPANAGGLICWAIEQESTRLAVEFKSLDGDSNGELSLAEYDIETSLGIPGVANKQTFARLDTNKDGRLSKLEHRGLPWHVVARHCELETCPVPLPNRQFNATTYSHLVDEDDLKMAPPLSGRFYDRKSGVAVNALLQLSQSLLAGKETNGFTVVPKSGMKDLDTDDNGKLTTEECWQFLYTHHPESFTSWTIHEWGTFTSLQDDNGRELGGINIDDEPVPKFVHNLAPYLVNSSIVTDPYWTQRRKAAPRRHPLVTMRLETPVVYFYPPENAPLPQEIDVDVKFHGGWLTEFYPLAKAGAPGLGDGKFRFGELTGKTVGSLSWKDLRVGHTGQVPKTDAHVWTAPRRVASQPVTTTNEESEQYLFYRGVGNLRAPLRVTTDRQLSLLKIYVNCDELRSEEPITIRGAWLAHIRSDRKVAFRPLTLSTAMRTTSELLGETDATFTASEYDAQNLQRLRQQMHLALVKDGLFEDEATAMLNTWQRAYFTSPGLRLFYLVPRPWTDRYLPLKLSVEANVERVMMGRIELIAENQRELLKQLAQGPTSENSWIRSIPKSEARTKLVDGRSDFDDLGVEIPADFQAYLDLGRFRNALVISESKLRPTEPLTKFIKNYGLSPYVWQLDSKE